MKQKQQTAMQELLAQLYEERTKLPMPKEWAHCLRSIEMAIEKHYIDKEHNQIVKAAARGYLVGEDTIKLEDAINYGKQYYNNTFKK